MGAGRPTKFHVARRIAAALGYLSLARLDRLGMASFADSLAGELPPLRHPTRFPRLLQGLETFLHPARRRPTWPARCGPWSAAIGGAARW